MKWIHTRVRAHTHTHTHICTPHICKFMCNKIYTPWTDAFMCTCTKFFFCAVVVIFAYLLHLFILPANLRCMLQWVVTNDVITEPTSFCVFRMPSHPSVDGSTAEMLARWCQEWDATLGAASCNIFQLHICILFFLSDIVCSVTVFEHEWTKTVVFFWALVFFCFDQWLLSSTLVSEFLCIFLLRFSLKVISVFTENICGWRKSEERRENNKFYFSKMHSFSFEIVCFFKKLRDTDFVFCDLVLHLCIWARFIAVWPWGQVRSILGVLGQNILGQHKGFIPQFSIISH